IMPGVAQLEMARCAAYEALGTDDGLQLRDIRWVRPVVVAAEGLDLHIALYPEEGDELSFEIYSDDEDGQAVVYSQGTIAIVSSSDSSSHDIAVLREQCTASRLSASECYAQFEQLG